MCREKTVIESRMCGFLKYRDRVPAGAVVRVAVDVRRLRERVDRRSLGSDGSSGL
jgi:hypothetical protein